MKFRNVSHGKDVRINLEYNLAMSEVLGRPGWLYNETKALHDEGAILSCSCDSPFQLRLLKGVSSDVSCLSKMCLYVSDPADISNPPLKQTKKDTAEYKREMEGRGDSSVNCRLCYWPKNRTDHWHQRMHPKRLSHFSRIHFQYMPWFAAYGCPFSRKWLEVACGLDVAVERPCSNM